MLCVCCVYGVCMVCMVCMVCVWYVLYIPFTGTIVGTIVDPPESTGGPKRCIVCA